MTSVCKDYTSGELNNNWFVTELLLLFLFEVEAGANYVSALYTLEDEVIESLPESAGVSHLHLQLLGGNGLQLGGNGALQRVANQNQTLTAVV